ncbi:MAG: hypothetical protein H7Y31_11310, partial [Chitinophagaceae bacterium]|nr:hypothetical protein [Chitinophagaceae bacterium]
PAFEEAVQLDPNYAPSWYELFFYYYYRDVNKAAEYFDKYLAVSDASPNNEYDRISIIYARKMYTEAIAAAQQKITAEADKADPRYYKLIAYSYDESKDSANAKTYMDQYFAKQKPEGVLPKDYSFYAKLLGQFSQYDDAYKNYRLAIAADTSMEAKVDLLKEASALAKKSGNRAEEANWLGEAYKMKPNPNQNDLYNWGLAHYQSANYVTADSIFCGLYQTAYPNEIFGYLWCARAKEGQDTTWASGIAEAPYQMLADKAITIDSTKYKRIAIDARFKLVVFYNDVKKDKDAAIRELDKILSMDAANADATRIRDILNKPAPKTAPPARPRTGTTKPPAPPKPPVKNGNR